MKWLGSVPPRSNSPPSLPVSSLEEGEGEEEGGREEGEREGEEEGEGEDGRRG